MSEENLLKDVEAEFNDILYPVMMLGSAEILFSFVRRVFFVLTAILLFSASVGAAFVYYQPLNTFVTSTTLGLTCYALLVVCPFIALLPLYYYFDRRRVFFVLLGIFTFGFSLAVGVTCAFTGARIILEGVVLTLVMVVSVTLYTYWAGKHIGQDHYASLCGALSVIIAATLIQIYFPLVNIPLMICASLYAIIFCIYLIVEINYVVARYAYGEFMWAAVDIYLYLDIFRLFVYCFSCCCVRAG